MNKRIKLLAEQAGVKMNAYGRPIPASLASNFDEFALLIVRECARVAIEKQTENDVLNIVSKNPAKDFAYALVKHFGVEE